MSKLPVPPAMMSAFYDKTTTIGAMRHQEAKRYRCENYFHFPLDKSSRCHLDMIMISTDCRNHMVDWCYRIADFCNFEREIVEVAVSCFDLYMNTKAGRTGALFDRKVFQLAMMTALYIAVKMNEEQTMDLEFVSTLSQGAYTAEQVQSMELKMLDALEFRVNPPTSLAFVREFVQHYYCHLLSSSIDSDNRSQRTKQKVYELAKIQTEAAVRDHRFLAVKKSTIALAAVMNSMQLATCIDIHHSHVMQSQRLYSDNKSITFITDHAAGDKYHTIIDSHEEFQQVKQCLLGLIRQQITVTEKYQLDDPHICTNTEQTLIDDVTTITEIVGKTLGQEDLSIQSSPRCSAEAI